MKSKNLTFFAAVPFLFLPNSANQEQYTPLICTPPEEIVIEKTDPQPLTTYAQETWISALEWCESRGKPSAINPKDSDGTPSYYSFSFKPGTFRWLGEKYGVIKKGHTEPELMELLKETDLQKDIVRFMISDPTIIWENQFPSCVRLLGRPPIY